MHNDSIQKEKYISPLLSSDFTMKIEATKYSKINASKFDKIKSFSKDWKKEIIPQIIKAKTPIIFDFWTPKKRGIVFKFWASYFKSRISKGIVMAKTNRNRDINCKITLYVIGMLFSSTNNNIVLIVHTKEIINILLKGSLLKPKGYSKESTPENMIAIWVEIWNLKK